MPRPSSASCFCQKGERIDVEILAIDVDAPLLDAAVQEIDEELPRFCVAEVEQPVAGVVGLQQKLGMLPVELGS